MTRIISTIHLSDVQKEVLAKIKAAPNAHMAWEVIQQTEGSIDANFANARDTLADLGLLTVADGTIEITPQGDEQMTKENITDESGELSDMGNQLAGTNRDEVQSAGPSGDGMGDDAGMDGGMGGEGGEEDPFASMGDEGGEDPFGDENLSDEPFESFSLLKDLNNAAEIITEQKRLSKK